MKKLGFTLIEVLIIVLILSIITIVVMVTQRGITDRAIFSTAKSNLAILQRQIWLYRTAEGNYPETLDKLVTKGYINRVPLLNIKYHTPSDEVVVSTEPHSMLYDLGKWCYNPATGIISIACTHKDHEGKQICNW
ncbi:MAG: prepilin-type N-terminal cleavage/methylation domain-containing protein [Endomicrobia bacterium]|nr:prepilin-type N-terminal cleavage/methylation domain-containing protein [Endomicrobiia bacterium]